MWAGTKTGNASVQCSLKISVILEGKSRLLPVGIFILLVIIQWWGWKPPPSLQKITTETIPEWKLWFFHRSNHSGFFSFLIHSSCHLVSVPQDLLPNMLLESKCYFNLSLESANSITNIFVSILFNILIISWHCCMMINFTTVFFLLYNFLKDVWFHNF